VASDRKILFTGATGQAIRPCAEAMAADNEVWCVARFSNPDVKAELEAKGIKTFPWTMGESSLDGLDEDFTHVVHAAPYRGQPDFDTAAQANAVGAGMLMHHCRRAKAFLFVSTMGVYAKPPTPGHPVAETDALGGFTPYAPSYGQGKLAAEGAVRAFARVLELPTTIARLNVCYGPTGWGGLPIELSGRVLAGEPVWMPRDGNPIPCSPISTEDVAALVPGLWDAASTSATIVNLAGDEATSVEEFISHLAGVAGLEPDFVRDERSRESFVSDNTRRKALVGDCTVSWRDGMPRAIEAHYPGALSGERTEARVATNIWDQA
jgi:nucleoside-diphosphate-sugar epimerase